MAIVTKFIFISMVSSNFQNIRNKKWDRGSKLCVHLIWYTYRTVKTVYFFGGLDCVGQSFAYVAHFVILRGLDSNLESRGSKQVRYQICCKSNEERILPIGQSLTELTFRLIPGVLYKIQLHGSNRRPQRHICIGLPRAAPAVQKSVVPPRQAQRTNQGRTPFISTLWVQIHLSFNSQQGPHLSDLSDRHYELWSIHQLLHEEYTGTGTVLFHRNTYRLWRADYHSPGLNVYWRGARSQRGRRFLRCSTNMNKKHFRDDPHHDNRVSNAARLLLKSTVKITIKKYAHPTK
jgi:hypothetical protein